MSGGYDIVTTLGGYIRIVAWYNYYNYISSKSAPTREEAIANMRILLAKRRVLGI